MRFCFPLLAVSCLISLGPVSAQVTGKKYALCVGVENYEHARLREPTLLKYAVEDATELASLMKQKGFEVVLLTDDTGRANPKLRPTKANIESHLAAQGRKCQAADTLLVAFAGHGLQFAGQKDAYFCPQDARPFAEESATLVSVTKIYAELEKSFAGVKVILIDACRNDPDPGRGRGLDADSAPAPPKGVAALFSCSAGQRAYEHDKLQHGVFFHHVLKGLRGEAANARSEVTFSRLSEYVSDAVPGSVSRLIPGHEQFPNLKADLVGRSPVLLSAGGNVITNSIGMKLVLVPAGEFMMGTSASNEDIARQFAKATPALLEIERPQHRVQILHSFYMGQHEVTIGQFRQFVQAINYTTDGERDGHGGLGMNGQGNYEQKREYIWKSPGFAQDDNHPVTCVTWYDASRFCRWLSQKEGKHYGLPTEAQWEYACRAGGRTWFQHGNDAEGLAAAGNVADASLKAKFPKWSKTMVNSRDGYDFTAPVGRFAPNAFGLYDMHGNVQEWCADFYDEKYYSHSPAADPMGPVTGTNRVLRGSDWAGGPLRTRTPCRFYNDPLTSKSAIGFRVTLEP